MMSGNTNVCDNTQAAHTSQLLTMAPASALDETRLYGYGEGKRDQVHSIFSPPPLGRKASNIFRYALEMIVSIAFFLMVDFYF